MHKITSGARLTIFGKKYINKQLSKHVTSAFKLYYSQIDAYHKKAYYFRENKTFWVIQSNSLPCINKISRLIDSGRFCVKDFVFDFLCYPGLRNS